MSNVLPVVRIVPVACRDRGRPWRWHRDLLSLSLSTALLVGCAGAPDRGDVRETPDAALASAPASDAGVETGTVPAEQAAGTPAETLADTPTDDGTTDTLPPGHGSGRIDVPELTETSGLALSRRDPSVLWALNDGGNAPALHALDGAGRALGRWTIDAPNRDWEDLAAFRLDGEPVLLIADTGDNSRRRETAVLHLVAEPPVVADGTTDAAATTLRPLRSLRFSYEDGPHDVEAVAVDETTRTIWLLTKEAVQAGRGVAGGAYALSLDDDPPLVARRRTTLAAVSRGLTESLAAAVAGVDLAQPTAFDIDAAGVTGCLLTYRRVRCIDRADGESWDEALTRPLRALPEHGLEQAEALALTADGRRLWLTSEGAAPPLQARPVR